MPESGEPGTVVMEPSKAGRTVEYLSASQLQALYGLKNASWNYLRQSPWMIDPDVVVGRSCGWSEERALRFGRETGRIDEQGRPRPAYRRGKPKDSEMPPDWYRRIPERFMTAREASYFMGLNQDGMFRLRRRGDYPQPAVRVGNNPRRRTEGWDKETCLRFALRRGWITHEEEAAIRARMAAEARRGYAALEQDE